MQIASTTNGVMANSAPGASAETQQPAPSADPSAGATSADSTLSGGSSRSSQPWGKPEFLQPPSVGSSSSGSAMPKSDTFLFDDRAPTSGTRPMFDDLPAPSYVGHGSHALVAQTSPRRDGGQTPPREGAAGSSGATSNAADSVFDATMGLLGKAKKVEKFGEKVVKADKTIKQANKEREELYKCIDIPAPPSCPTSGKDLQKMADKADESRIEAIRAMREAYEAGIRVPGTSTGGPIVVKP